MRPHLVPCCGWLGEAKIFVYNRVSNGDMADGHKDRDDFVGRIGYACWV